MSLIPGAVGTATQLTDGAVGGSSTSPLSLPYGTKYTQLSVSGDTTVVTNDGTYLILVTTAGTNRTVTLPAAADNDQRVLIVKKVDSGTGYVIIEANGSETIDGSLQYHVQAQYQEIAIWSDGTNWVVIGGDDSEYAYNTNNTDAADTTSFGNGASGQLFNFAPTADRAKRCRFLRSIAPGDTISLEISVNGTTWWEHNATAIPNGANPLDDLTQHGSVFYGLGVLRIVNSTDVDMQFSQYRAASTTYNGAGANWTAYAGSLYWRIRKKSR